MFRKFIPSAVVAFFALAVTASSAVAAGGEQVGKKTGDWLQNAVAIPLYGGVAAVVAVVFLVNRKYNELALFCGAALVVAGFVFAPASISGMARDIWNTVTA